MSHLFDDPHALTHSATNYITSTDSSIQPIQPLSQIQHIQPHSTANSIHGSVTCILHEECDGDADAALTVDCFGELLANGVQVFKQRKVFKEYKFVCVFVWSELTVMPSSLPPRKDIRLRQDYEKGVALTKGRASSCCCGTRRCCTDSRRPDRGGDAATGHFTTNSLVLF